MPEFPVTLEFVGGPDDGGTAIVSSRRLVRGERQAVIGDKHEWVSLIPWNGVARWVKLYHHWRHT